jgi:hypothetical protein
MLPCKQLLVSLLIGVLAIMSCLPVNAQGSKEEFKPYGKIWGYAFGDFFVKAGGDTATWSSKAEYSGVAKDIYAFSLRRMYLGYDYSISPVFSAAVILESQDAFQDARGDRTLTIKSLHLRWKNIYKRADLLVGQMPTLSFSFLTEKIWTYRSIEKLIIDQRAIRPSSDFGVALIGHIDSLANFGYNLMIGNGSGTRPENLTKAGSGKIFSVETFGYFLDRKIILELYGDFENAIEKKNQFLWKAMLAYQTGQMTLGVETMHQTLYHSKIDGSNAVPFGLSIFVRGSLVDNKLDAFARYDWFNQDLDYRQTDALTTYNKSTMYQHYDEQFLVAGLDYSPHKNVHIMPNIWVNRYEPKVDNNILVARKSDVVPRLTFMFSYK